MSRERRERSSTTAARLVARSNEPSSYRFAPAQHTSAATVTRSFESLIVNARALGGDSLAHLDEFYEP